MITQVWINATNRELKESLSKEEIETVKYADLTTSVSKDICQRLHKLHNKTSIRITNGFDINEKIVKKDLSKKILRLNKTFKIVYTGLIYNDRSPDHAFRCNSKSNKKKKDSRKIQLL